MRKIQNFAACAGAAVNTAAAEVQGAETVTEQSVGNNSITLNSQNTQPKKKKGKKKIIIGIVAAVVVIAVAAVATYLVISNKAENDNYEHAEETGKYNDDETESTLTEDSSEKEVLDISGNGEVLLADYKSLTVYEDDVRVTDEDWEELVASITSNYATIDAGAPDFDDDFVQEYYWFYGCDTAEEMKEYIINQVYVSNIINEVWDDFVEACEVVSYDEDELESYVSYIEEQYDSQYKEYYSVDLDTYLSAMDIDRDEWDETNLETAKAYIKEKMIYIAIAEAEGLVPTQEEYEAEAQLYVDVNGFNSLDELEESYGREETIYAVIVNRVQMYLGDAVTVLEGSASGQ